MKGFHALNFLAIFALSTYGSVANVNPNSIATTYLTFQQVNTSDNITVNYHVNGDSDVAQVYYDTTSRGGRAEKYTHQALGQSEALLGTPGHRFHRVELESLLPNTTYYFIAGNDQTGYTREFKFHTLPDDDTPISFIQGGDMGDREDIVPIAASALEKEPDLILIGGDIAYADGKLDNVHRWHNWFKIMNRTMITPDGYLLPLVVAVGNHEVGRMFGKPHKKAPFYFQFFKQNNDKTYFVRELGDHTVLIVLDTGHVHPHSGKQKDFLKDSLAEYADWDNKMALYHIPMYPSHRDYDGIPSAITRFSWLKAFEDGGLNVAFENHDHAFKRTKMMIEEAEVEKDGIVFIGDGCWGKSAREITHKHYLHKAESVQHVWSVQASPGQIQFTAEGIDGEIFDEFDLHTHQGNELVEYMEPVRTQWPQHHMHHSHRQAH